MGTDIHIIVEVKELGNWRLNTDKIFKNFHYDPEEKNKSKEFQLSWKLNEFQANPGIVKFYDWFAILANVRNGFSGQNFNIIANPKGLPVDLSSEGLKFFCFPITNDFDLNQKEDNDGNYYIFNDNALKWIKEGYSVLYLINGKQYVSNPDYYSYSYLSSNDFDKFDWNQVTMKYGIIRLEQYKNLRYTNDAPDEWSCFVGGSDCLIVNTDEADKLLDDEKHLSTIMFKSHIGIELKIYVEYEWPVIYSDWFNDEIKYINEPLKKLSNKYEDARIVFAFDS